MKIILAIRFQWMDGNIESRGTMQYSYKDFSNAHRRRWGTTFKKTDKKVITKWTKINF